MGVYSADGTSLSSVYDADGSKLSQAYDANGTPLLDGEEEFIKTILPYSTNYIIKADWLANATTQRNAMTTAFNESSDAIPFFIQTDGHGRYNEGNKGCHNLTEASTGYIRNIMLGDWDSYYYDGQNPSKHKTSSNGISKYIPVMGNHEFMSNNSEEAVLADLPTLVDSYVPSDGILGSETYGYYKVLDDKFKVKYLVTQPHIPDSSASSGLATTMTSDQYSWLADELGLDDGYDIVFVQHEPLGGTYVKTEGGTYNWSIPKVNVAELLRARKAKEAGTFVDSNGTSHVYDFTECETDLLCALHGHIHKEIYMTKATYGFPIYCGDWFGNSYTCAYGLIDRENGMLKIWKFSNSAVANVLELEL